MSWLFSQVLVEGYLGDTSLDGAPCALWNGMPTQQASWLPDKMTDACRLSRSGMTFKPLTDDLGEGVLMSYLEAFPVRTSPPLARVQASKASEAVCGNTWRESSAKYCRNTCSWKTHRCLWEEDLPSSSLTLPKWGMMQGGVLWERTMSQLPTSETESGFLLPTPTCADATMGAMWPTPKAHEPGMTAKTTGRGVEKSTHLTTQVALAEGMIDRETGRLWPTPQDHKITRSGEMWPTPAARDCKGANSREHCETNGTGRKHMDLCFATPQARDFRTGQQSRWENPERTRNLNDHIGGKLNPTWVEKLMGWPQNWTEAKPMIDFQFISWLMGFCECEKTRTNEIMRVLRNSNGAQNFQRKAGRPIGIQEAEVLLSLMFQHKIGTDEAWILMEGAEAPQGEVRGVRLQAGATSSPRRSGHQEQPTGEHPDAMQTLPRLLAYDGEAAWKDQSWENAVPRVATAVAARVDRLRCIGNGQVPAVAQLAWETLNT